MKKIFLIMLALTLPAILFASDINTVRTEACVITNQQNISSFISSRQKRAWILKKKREEEERERQEGDNSNSGSNEEPNNNPGLPDDSENKN